VTPFAGACAFTAVALAALLWVEWHRVPGGAWATKPLASLGFLVAAWAAGALDSGYGRTVLAALVLCFAGDVLLIPKARASFLAGLVAFLLGHVGFAAAFAARGQDAAWAGAAALAVVPAAAGALRWLAPHVEPAMRWPVRAYVAVISAMVLLAAGTVGAAGGPVVLAGALCFYVSDLAVARERFVASTPWNRMWGLPLYYGAQLLLASSVG
jgi:uncharacterized membrane protein YhhN